MEQVPGGYCQPSTDGLSVWFTEELPDTPTETVPTDFDGDGVIEDGEYCVRYLDTGEEFCGE